RAAGSRPAWRLRVVGEGGERLKLEAAARELGVVSKVDLPGRTATPERDLEEAELFVLTSRFEGFPNALLEAMAHGAVPVSFDCPAGPREIIRDGVDGVLVANGDVDALAAGLARLMDDANAREEMRHAARAGLERFSFAN